MISLRQTFAVLAITTMCTQHAIIQVQASGLQSGPSSGSMFAGGMLFDKGDDTLYMTGIHYSEDITSNTVDRVFSGDGPSADTSSCFVASMRLSLDETSSSYEFEGIGDWRSQVNDVGQESCMAVALHRPSQVVVIGTKETLIPDNPPIEGSIAVFDRNAISNKKLSETTLVDQDNTMTQLVYPVAITSDTKSSDFMYVVVLASKDAQDNSDQAGGKKYPDWLKVQRYGSAFDMHVSKIKLTQGNGSGMDGIPIGSVIASKEWTTEFPLDSSNNAIPPRVYIGGIIHKTTQDNQSLVIVVGSTRGSGLGYGESDGDDEDGFVTVIDPSNGDILGEGSREGSAEDDIVTGVCDDPNDPKHFFIVGGTEGVIGVQQADNSISTPNEMLQPFLRQVQADRSSSDDDNLWTMQWAVTQGASSNPAFGSAVGCVVDGDYIYVAGTVDGGASLVQGKVVTKSQGGDDVWIAKIDKNSQKVHWITQLGSNGDDRLARYGGIDIDNAGHPIIFGDTTGEMYRTRDSSEDDSIEDMFVMSLDKITGDVMTNSDEVFVGGISSTMVPDDEGGTPTFYPTIYETDDEIISDDVDSAPTFFPTRMINTNDSTDSNDVRSDDDDSTDSNDIRSSDEDNTGFPTNLPTAFSSDANTEEIKQPDDTDPDDTHSFNPVGLQIKGPAYAGGVVYDSQANTALLTGATYMVSNMEVNPTSLCFTGLVDLYTGDLKSQHTRGSQEFSEACTAITFDTNRNSAYAIGSTEAWYNGEFQDKGDGKFIGNSGGAEWTQGESNSVSGGLIFQMDQNLQLWGGNRVVDYPVIYPVSVVTHPLDVDYLFVASMASEKTGENAGYSAGSNYPNFLATDNREYGSRFFLTVNRYKITDVPNFPGDEGDDVPNTLDKSWVSEFGTDVGEGVTVEGMVMAGNGNVLVVVGSTRGAGGPFDTNEGDNDMDGFILKINPEDGKLADISDGSKFATRLDSVNKKDDYIFNVCNDRFDHDAIYVVGKSEGHIRDLSDAEQPPEGSTHAFVAKVNLKSLRAEWLKHFTMTIPGDGVRHAEALSCTVTPDSNGDNIVYVGGTVSDYASMDSNSKDVLESYGKEDIFVASMNGNTGDMNWMQQMGTSENDRLATGQGLDVDSFGNAIVYAETTGNFYDEHGGINDAPDLVIFTVNKRDGTYLTPRTDGGGIGSDELAEVADNDDNTLTIPAPRNRFAAIQTNDDAIPSYAGGMHFDQFTNAIYLTGASYTTDNVNVVKSSQCLFGIATLPQLEWKQKKTYGTSKAPEACSSISLANLNGKSEPIMVGSSEKSGLLDDLRTARRASQYGMVLDLQNNGGSWDLIGGTVVDEERIQFPVKVLADNDKVFLVSMASKSDEVQPDSERADGKKYPNFTTGGIEKYGSQYEILVERHTLNRDEDLPPGSIESTMSLDWRKPLETADQRSIFVSGMAVIDEGAALIVVGSTQGTEKDDDFDGIMAKVSTATGSFASEGDEARSVAYFSSVSGADDWILNVCSDTDDERFFYVTGATGGEMDNSISKQESDVTVHAVVSKIQTDTLNIVWTTQYEVRHASGTTDREAASVALGCATVPGKGRLYVAGDVEDGAILESATESAGGDDIFVSMLDSNTGEKIWTKQVGSGGDDRVARGGGIVADANGNAVVYGDTTGNFHRMRDTDFSVTSDLFLMIFNQDDGAHENSMSKQSERAKNKAIKKAPAPAEWFGTNYKKDPKLIGMIAGAIFSALVLMLSCCVLYRRTRSRRELVKHNSIFNYLQQFSVEDIDLRKSPPGGWHGTYLNKLAHGVNTAASLPETSYKDDHLDADDKALFDSAKMVHSSVKDSLFMDVSSAPALGGIYYSDQEENPLKTRNINENKFSIV